MFPLLRYPGVMQVICTLGALSECVGNHQLLPSLLPLRSRTYFANNQHSVLVQAVIGRGPGVAARYLPVRRGRAEACPGKLTLLRSVPSAINGP